MSADSRAQPQEREVRSFSPEARKQRARHGEREPRSGIMARLKRVLGPGSRVFEVAGRVLAGTYNEGFIHAGNLAYLSMVAIFPFFVLGAALFELIGGRESAQGMIAAIGLALPPTVAEVIAPVAETVMEARSGWLLALGALVALWTVSSLIETIRDILRRAYGTVAGRAFWQYRIGSIGMIFASVVLLMLTLAAQVGLLAAEQVLIAYFPRLDAVLSGLFFSRLVSAAILFLTFMLLFASLTPQAYQGRRYPKWPGALLISAWWSLLIEALPFVLRRFFTYDLTYGSLAGVMIALFFFWLVGLGLLVGAALNAALAVTPEEAAAANRDAMGQPGNAIG